MNLKRMACAAAVVVVAAGTLGREALAQWSASAGANLVVADKTNEQVQPKIAAIPANVGGGAYVAWYDNSAGGYDVYLQRLSAQGVEQWAHNGVLIADRNVSSTVDYSLACDADGNAVIVFNDDRTNPQQITLQKVTPAGALVFNGSAGINVGAASAFASPPTVAVLADGNYGVIWNNSSVSPVATSMQKVHSATGAGLWNTGLPLNQQDWLSPARPVQASDCQSDGAGGMIVLFVRCTGTNCVTSNKQLYAQRYNALGQPQWNSGAPVAVFAGTSSIQTATYPRFVPDGNGGAVFGWYENGSSRYAYIQHILPDGTPKFASPVATTGANGARIRVGVGFAYNRSTGEYFEAFDEADASTQANHTIVAQRINSNGTLAWGNGIVLRGPEGFFQSSFIQVAPAGDGCVVSWIWLDNTTSGYVYAARITGEGTVSWNQQVSSTYQGKSRLVSAAGSCGDPIMLAFGAGASGAVDIDVQNVMLDGTLGPGTCPAFFALSLPRAIMCPGGTVHLTGQATGNSAPCYAWRRGGTALVNGGRVSGADSSALTLTGLTVADGGVYDVVASNTCGTAISAPGITVVVCKADFNCSGSLEVQDIFDFINAWLAGDARADYNGGGVSVQDIFDFINGWMAGC